MAKPQTKRWQLQDAKQHFSQVVREVEAGNAQIVTRHGKEVAVIIEFDEYQHLKGEARGFKDALRDGPRFDDLVLERDKSLPRDVDLAEQ